MSDVSPAKIEWGSALPKDSLTHTEVPVGNYGNAGAPIPYSMRNDNVITALLLAFFIVSVIAFAKVKGFIIRQAKGFFYSPKEGTSEILETAGEMRFQLLLVVLTSILLSLLYYFYTIQTGGDTFLLDSPYELIVILLGVFLTYFFLKTVFYGIVNYVFFGGKRNEQWTKTFLFIIDIEGVLLFPGVAMIAYLDLPVQSVEIYFVAILIIVKILTIYKTYIIFFRKNVVYLQIFLYFCALEITPLLALWGVLELTTNNIRINF